MRTKFYLLIACILGILIAWIVVAKSCNKKAETFTGLDLHQGIPLKVYDTITVDGKEIVVYRDRIINNSSVEKAESVGKSYIDSVSMALDVAVKKLKQVEKINATLLVENKQLVHEKESLIVYRDKWNEIVIDKNTDTLVKFISDVSLNTVAYSKSELPLA